MKLSSFCSPSFVNCILIVFLVSLLPLPNHAQQKPSKKVNLAVLDFDTRSAMSKDEAATLSDNFQSYLVDIPEFNVLDRGRIKSLLQELGFQQSEACSQVECVVEAGRMLKAEKMFSGTIGKVGKNYSVNIFLIDVATAKIEINKSRQHSGDIEEIAEAIIPEIAEEIASQMLGREVKVRRMISGGTSWLWYAGGVFLLGGGVAAYLYFQPSTSTPDKKTLPTPPTLPQ